MSKYCQFYSDFDGISINLLIFYSVFSVQKNTEVSRSLTRKTHECSSHENLFVSRMIVNVQHVHYIERVYSVNYTDICNKNMFLRKSCQ